MLRRFDYDHPVYTAAGVAAQAPPRRDQRRPPHPLLRRLLGLGLPRGRRRQRPARLRADPAPDARTDRAASLDAAAPSPRGRAGGAGRMTASAVYEGWVRHRRFEPVEHDFRYRLFLMYLDLGELPGRPRSLPVVVGPPRAPRPASAARDFMGDPARPLEECARDAVEAADRRPPRRPGAAAHRPALPRPLLQPGQLLLLLRPAGRAGRGGRRRRQEHPLGRAASLRPRPRRARGTGAERRARQGAARLPPDGDGPDLRLPRHRARRAARRPHRVPPRAPSGERQVLRRDPLAAPPRAEPARCWPGCSPATRRCRCRWWRRSTRSRCG